MKKVILALTIGISLNAMPLPGYAVDRSNQASFQQGVDLYDLGRYREAYDVWLKLARENNDPDAMRNIGQILRLGLGVDQQLDLAFLWYNRAAEAGLASAQVITAIMLLRGEGTTKDQAQAAEWFRKAAEQGDVTAQYNLALMYEHGLGIRQDVAIAQSWYEKAKDNGHAGAAKRLPVVQKKLEKQLAEVSVTKKDVVNNTNDSASTLSSWSAPLTETSTINTNDIIDKNTKETEVKEKSTANTNTAKVLENEPVQETPATTTKPRSAINTVEEIRKSNALTTKAAPKTENSSKKIVDSTIEQEIPNRIFSNENNEEGTKKPPQDAPTKLSKPKETQKTVTQVKEAIKPVQRPQNIEVASVDTQSKPAISKPTKRTAPVEKEVQKSTVQTIIEKTKNVVSPTAQDMKKAEKSYAAGNYTAARNVWTRLADKDVAEAQFWLGRLYNRGEGVTLDRQKAYSLWKKASENGYSPATTALINLVSRFGQTDADLQKDVLLNKQN